MAESVPMAIRARSAARINSSSRREAPAFVIFISHQADLAALRQLTFVDLATAAAIGGGWKHHEMVDV
jgi:hypothetical protein